eukprot:TRINITY_DN3482_c0_g1_i4.p1 TRINITY_DN3482_c0_g1~~TRINITY_DN3482_c0_g1_i4.p1  ORF type:complete len:227 (+),score=37.98 TRINITY_DN3482_c0_g1_i4:81-683(+)
MAATYPHNSPLPLLSLNHISLNCRSIPRSLDFYTKMLGFQLAKPPSFSFNGAWLFNYGVGIHLLDCKSVENLPAQRAIDPRDNHISFQCQDMEKLQGALNEMEVTHVKRVVEDGGVRVEQLFIHDPDGYVIELCNCENFPVVFLKSDWNSACACAPVSASAWPYSPVNLQDQANLQDEAAMRAEKEEATVRGGGGINGCT